MQGDRRGITWHRTLRPPHHCPHASSLLHTPPPQLSPYFTLGSALIPSLSHVLLALSPHPQDLPGSDAGGLLDILADLPLQALPPLLQLLNGTLLGELVGGASELTLRQGAAEQLLVGGKERSGWPSPQGLGTG